jgi:3-phenylpropionate/cinnamic acid dioxygenase small subunit
MVVDIDRVAEFLFREARLADEHRYDEWLSLWGERVLYYAPCNDDSADPARHTAIIIDDRQRLEERIARLKGGAAHAQDPPSRLRRVIGNVEVVPGPDANRVEVWSNFVLFETRRGRQQIYAGRCKHVLELGDDGQLVSMLEKRVFLVTNDEPLGNLTFLL